MTDSETPNFTRKSLIFEINILVNFSRNLITFYENDCSDIPKGYTPKIRTAFFCSLHKVLLCSEKSYFTDTHTRPQIFK